MGTRSYGHGNGTNKKQLDYIILPAKKQADVLKCKVIPDVDTGSDHRPIMVRFVTGARVHRKTHSSRPSWGPGVEKNTFRDTLDRQLRERPFTTHDLDAASARIEEDLSAAVLAANPPAKKISRMLLRTVSSANSYRRDGNFDIFPAFHGTRKQHGGNRSAMRSGNPAKDEESEGPAH